MSQQIISIGPDGSISGLQHKRGKGVDLRKFGKADIQRVTLIEWDGDEQRWFIRWQRLKGGHKFSVETIRGSLQFVPVREGGRPLKAGQWRTSLGWAGIQIRTSQGLVYGYYEQDYLSNPTLMFDEYEEAVKVEVEVFQAMQMQGKISND